MHTSVSYLIRLRTHYSATSKKNENVTSQQQENRAIPPQYPFAFVNILVWFHPVWVIPAEEISLPCKVCRRFGSRKRKRRRVTAPGCEDANKANKPDTVEFAFGKVEEFRRYLKCSPSSRIYEGVVKNFEVSSNSRDYRGCWNWRTFLLSSGRCKFFVDQVS